MSKRLNDDNNDKFSKRIKLSNVEIWKTKLEQVKEYINENNKLPSQNNKNNNIKKLGEWLSSQHYNYKNNKYIMKNENIRKQYEEFIKEYKKYFINNIELWKTNFEKVKEYININNKLPSTSNENIEIKQLAEWLIRQQYNYKREKNIMKSQTIRKKYKDFIEEYKEYFISNEELWNIKLEKIKKYAYENNKLPSNNDINNNIKQLGVWLSKQEYNYKKRKNIMKNETIRKQYEQFIIEYANYFIINDELWGNNLEPEEERLIVMV